MRVAESIEPQGARAAPAPRRGGDEWEIAVASLRHWPAVRIVGVEIEEGKPSIPAGYRRVRVGIQLGPLTPADVRVHMVPARARADSAPFEARTVRLWSALSYGNGVYVFEGHVPERALEEPGRMRLQVTPGPGSSRGLLEGSP